MHTILSAISLKELLSKPVMLDANILMVGIGERISNPDYSFERMKQIYISPIFESFKSIVIHEAVYNELDDESRKLVDQYKDKNVSIVGEGTLYGTDPKYTSIFNAIAGNGMVDYKRGQSKNKGEIYSLAYAAYNNLNYFCSKDVMVDLIADEIPVLKEIRIITFDVIVLLSYLYHNVKEDQGYNKALRSIYKRHCEDVIKRHKLPKMLKEYIEASLGLIA